MSVFDSKPGSFLKFRRERPSLLFALASFLAEKKIPGAYRLIDLLSSLGILDRTVSYKVNETVNILVPLHRPDNRFSEKQIQGYEKPFIDSLSEKINKLEGETTLIDCGADIGTFSVLLFAQSPNISNIICFEPNLLVWEVLRANLDRLPTDTTVYPFGAGKIFARGKLTTPDYDQSDHARFVENSPQGDIPIVPIDDLQLPGSNIVLKIDVEGTELDVLKGARNTLVNADNIIIGFEINKRVIDRVGANTVIEIAEFIDSISECTYQLAELPGVEINKHEDLITKIPDGIDVINVICYPK